MKRRRVIGRVVYSRRPRPFNFKAVKRVWRNLLIEEDVTDAKHVEEFVELFAMLWHARLKNFGLADQEGSAVERFRAAVTILVAAAPEIVRDPGRLRVETIFPIGDLGYLVL